MARRRQAVTIRHVAADAGVSLQTVSRVINNEPNVRPEMTRRVQEAIDRLGYVPSIAAQRMGGSRSRLIMAFNDRDRTIADWRRRDGSNWLDQMLLGGMLTCARQGYRMIVELVDTHSDHIEGELAAVIAALQPDGVLLTPPHSQNRAIVDLLASHHIAIARIGSLAPGPGFLLTMDDDHAARLATEHLVALGHRHIGFIAGSEEYELSEWRIAGWRAAMAAAGLTDEGLLCRGDFGWASGRRCAMILLDGERPPTAIIASSDQMALATLDLARGRGMSVPSDLSIVSFDDTPIVRFAQPPLTAVVQPIAEITERAVELIVQAEQGEMPSGAPLAVPCHLAIRGSTAPPPSAG
ncbi:LacI family DNA-binding transcriptional regulator [Sphingomonas bacterium]|uniref:LacI family DNA-binding transcriptional regulator n=1 Tax=Sphingomonas bacterium TaxID=1895847 RepID=UPI001575C3B9|nr:substrate-binding domain-containing protein [Sphingomonas bacterium]